MIVKEIMFQGPEYDGEEEENHQDEQTVQEKLQSSLHGC